MIGRVRGWGRAVRNVLAMEVPRSISRELVPLCLPAFLFPWLCVAMRHYLDATSFRDVNLFSYAGYCFRRGERMYSDFITPDGPLIYLIEAAFQKLCMLLRLVDKGTPDRILHG